MNLSNLDFCLLLDAIGNLHLDKYDDFVAILLLEIDVKYIAWVASKMKCSDTYEKEIEGLE